MLARDFSLRSKSLTPKSVTIPHHLFFVLTRNRSAESAPPGALTRNRFPKSAPPGALTRNRFPESAHPGALCQLLIRATLRLAPPKSAPTSLKCKNTKILLRILQRPKTTSLRPRTFSQTQEEIMKNHKAATRLEPRRIFLWVGSRRRVTSLGCQNNFRPVCIQNRRGTGFHVFT